MVTAAQVKATTKFIKEHTQRYTLQCNREKDKDIIDHLDSITGVNVYIKQLIREDIEKNQE
ncbi:hypothetical protein [Adlercreutzia agrestimuris]|uniref:hypothetical protein n=1 Tax=Adlercreutzia agrestimuris TaxID=2941324 RepID=UPI00203E1B7E|nr:hypothetical protein [Adlercreutzia agrestimuris]